MAAYDIKLVIVVVICIMKSGFTRGHTFEKLSDQKTDYDQHYSPYYTYPTNSAYTPKIIPSNPEIIWLPYQNLLPEPSPLPVTPTTTRKAYSTTASPTACKSSTFRTSLGCPCNLVGQRCHPANSLCIEQADGHGICSCIPKYVVYHNTCINQTISPIFKLEAAIITASCFLPQNGVIGNIPVGAFGSTKFTLTLLSSFPVNVSQQYISVESSTGNILFHPLPRLDQVNSQTYSVVATDSTGINSNLLTFEVSYSCSAPVCSFDLGNSLIVDCSRFGVADTILTALATGTVAPTTFNMTLVSSTSTQRIKYYSIDQQTGQIFLQYVPHGGIFKEIYSVSATNGAGLTSASITLTVRTLMSMGDFFGQRSCVFS